MANNPVDLQPTLAGAIVPDHSQIGPDGRVYSNWWEGTPSTMAAATPTTIGVIQTQGRISRLILNIKNTGANTFTACKIQVRATPNGDWVDYLTSAQLNTGTTIAGQLFGTVGNPTTLAAGAECFVIVDLAGAWAMQVIATSTGGTTGEVFAGGSLYGASAPGGGSGGGGFTSGQVTNIVVAGSDAPASVQATANYVATGTNDDVVWNQATASLPGKPKIIQGIGTFSTSQSIRALSYTKLDLNAATFNVPTSWAASLRSVFQLGTNHALNWSFNNSTTPTFTVAAGGAGFLPGDVVYITGTLPNGYSSTQAYFIVNYVFTGYGAATCQLSLTSGGSPVAGAGGTTGTVGMSPAAGAYNTGTNILTLQGTSPPVLAKGQALIFSGGALAAGFALYTPYYVVPQGSNGYTLYSDAALTQQVTYTSGSFASFINVAPMQYGIEIDGGQINVPPGMTNNASFTAGWIRDNASCYRTFINNLQLNVDPTTGSGSFANAGLVFLLGYGSRVNGSTLIGGNAASIRCAGAAQQITNNEIVGSLGGVYGLPASGTTVGCPELLVCNNHIKNCQQNGVFLNTSSGGALIASNTFDNNCLAAPTVNAEIGIAGNSVIYICPNSFTLHGATTTVSGGTNVVNLSSPVLTGGATMTGNLIFSGSAVIASSGNNVISMNGGVGGNSTLGDTSSGTNIDCFTWGDIGGSQAVSFFAQTIVNQQTVTGAISSGAATNSLLAALANYGLIVNNATVNSASADLTAQSGAVASVVSFTPTATGTYLISGYVNVTAVSLTDVLNFQVTYTDENSVSRTQTMPAITLAGTVGIGIGPTTGNYAINPIEIRSGASAITVKTIVASGSGTITYDIGAKIQQWH